MRRSPAFATALLLALVSLQVHAQTATPASSKATRIEYPAPYAAMSVTTRAILTDGEQSTSLLFTETPKSLTNAYYGVMQMYATEPVTVLPGMSISMDALSVVRITAMTPRPCRRQPDEVSWHVWIWLQDSSGATLQPTLFDMRCSTPVPLDTIMSGSQRIDLSPYAGRSVRLKMQVHPEPCMGAANVHRVMVFDCTETQPLQSIR